MITSVRYENFGVLKDALLPLEPVTLVIGPNGVGKSTALRGIEAFCSANASTLCAAHTELPSSGGLVGITLSFNGKPSVRFEAKLAQNGQFASSWSRMQGQGSSPLNGSDVSNLRADLSATIYRLNASALANRAAFQPQGVLSSDGGNLCGVLDGMRDTARDAYESLEAEILHGLVEFDQIAFEQVDQNSRTWGLRLKQSRRVIRASELSEGTRFVVALLALAHQPTPPKLIMIEEPDHGLHPRMLRLVRDAMYRLAYPKDHGLDREPIQVILTTHSPVFLNFFQEHPNQVVIASKKDGFGVFERLSERAELLELIGDGTLADVWYTGVLGGVPQGV